MTKRGTSSEMTLNAPTLMACGAFISQRMRSTRCQSCYGRHPCRCGRDTAMPCISGEHMSAASRIARDNPGRGFGDMNRGAQIFARKTR